MLIGKAYKIESDAFNITVYHKRISKTKRLYWDAVGHFAKLSHALEFLVDLEVRKTGLIDLATVTKKQDELYNLIEGLSK